jgi:hypothetical protein
MLINGLYRLSFRTPLGDGAGVAVLRDGLLFGGNSYHCFVGSYVVVGQHVSAQFETQRHTEGAASLIGLDAMVLAVTGELTGYGMSGRGVSDKVPGVVIAFDLALLKAV